MIKYTPTGIIVDGTEIHLDTIIENVNAEATKKDNLVLMSISWPENRVCREIYEHIILPEERASKLKDLIVGREIYFGEINGKHSEIYGEVEADEVSISSGAAVTNFLKCNPCGHDYNHSFLNTFHEMYEEGQFELSGVTPDELQELIGA